MSLKLSVVVPCLDAADTLGTQLKALAGQRWPHPWEVIVADNGSTDGSQRVVEEFRGRMPNLRRLDAAERCGPGHARNAGAAAATGDALAFCDADDEVAPGWLAALGGALGEHPFVTSRYEDRKLNSPRIRQIHKNPQGTGLIPYDYPPFLPHAGGGGLGIRRRLHESIGGFDETLPALEDTDYCWRVQLAGTELVFVPEAVVHIRYRPTLEGVFRQGLRYGEHNVLIYKKYRPLGMPRLGWTTGLAKWVLQLARAPQLVTAAGRARWIWQLGWRTGRLRGCLRHRVAAL
jgi:glycosyltransferase involved in cell wall biosynthesis